MTLLFAVGMPGYPELLLIFLLVVLLFGARRLPDLARGIGRSITEFRKGRAEGDVPAKPDSKESV